MTGPKDMGIPLTPQQEEFLSRLFKLCDEYRDAQVSAVSLGICPGKTWRGDRVYSVQVDLIINRRLDTKAPKSGA